MRMSETLQKRYQHREGKQDSRNKITTDHISNHVPMDTPIFVETWQIQLIHTLLLSIIRSGVGNGV